LDSRVLWTVLMSAARSAPAESVWDGGAAGAIIAEAPFWSEQTKVVVKISVQASQRTPALKERIFLIRTPGGRVVFAHPAPAVYWGGARGAMAAAQFYCEGIATGGA
jgi:hypothetical protein